MKVLFIGGTGSISTACSRLCVERGIDLYLLNRGNHKDRIPTGVTFIEADINSRYAPDSLKGEEWDCVVDWTIMKKSDALRDIYLFSGYTKQFIYISSAGVYQPSPIGHATTETDKVWQKWDYARDKYQAELVLRAKRRKLPVTIVRPGHTYCEFTIPTNIVGLGYGLIERMKQDKKILVHDDGRSLWTLLHSSDFAVAFAGLIGKRQAIGETIHITGEETLTWLDIFGTYATALGIKPQFQFIPSSCIYQIDKEVGAGLLWDKALNRVFDNSKIKRFVPEYGQRIAFAHGIRESLEWHKRNPEKIFYNKQVNETVDRIIREAEKWTGRTGKSWSLGGLGS